MVIEKKKVLMTCHYVMVVGAGEASTFLNQIGLSEANPEQLICGTLVKLSVDWTCSAKSFWDDF
jgi:hypothetical protein